MNKPMHPVIACYGLTKSFSDANSTIDVLSNVKLEINAGEMVAIVGNSGSGKSTLLHLLGGLDKPTAGSVLLDGNNLAEVSEKNRCELRNRCLGFVYQFHHLLPEFSALENVGMPLLIRGEDPQRITERAEHLLVQVGLQDRMNHRLGQLSGGERQRTAIARALVTEPLCVLADEPTGNLDPRNAERVLELFFELQRTRQTSVIMVTHDLLIAKRAQRIYRLDHGNLVTE